MAVALFWSPVVRLPFKSLHLGFLAALGREGNGVAPGSQTIDPAFRRVLMYLLVGTKGGANRLQMLKLIREEPMNANKIRERLGLDYKTVQHHLKILKENNVVVTNASGSYGAMYFLTPYLEKNFSALQEIWDRFGHR